MSSTNMSGVERDQEGDGSTDSVAYFGALCCCGHPRSDHDVMLSNGDWECWYENEGICACRRFERKADRG